MEYYDLDEYLPGRDDHGAVIINGHAFLLGDPERATRDWPPKHQPTGEVVDDTTYYNVVVTDGEPTDTDGDAWYWWVLAVLCIVALVMFMALLRVSGVMG